MTDVMYFAPGLISVIVPVFNAKDFLDRCLKSIVNQTYTNIEIIVVDDGSDDGSGAICDGWEQRDCRIKVFHRENGGSYSARNLGLEKANGEFIGFIDSDDYIKEDMYMSLMQSIKEDIDIACCGTIIMKEFATGRLRKTASYDVVSNKLVLSNQEAVKELLLKRYLSFSTCNKLFRRELLDHIRFPDKKMCADLFFTYEAIKRSRKVTNIGKSKYFYCYREDSLSRRQFTMDRMNYVLFARDILKDVAVCYSQEVKMAEALYIRNIVTVIHEINQSEAKKEYKAVRKRLIKIIKRNYFNILLNKNISAEVKKDITNLILKY